MKNLAFALAVIYTVIYICIFIYGLLQPKPAAEENKAEYKRFWSVNSFISFCLGFCWTCYLYNGGNETYILAIIVGLTIVAVLHYIYKYTYILVNKVECICPENLDGMNIVVIGRLSNKDYIVRLDRNGEFKEMVVELYSDSDIHVGERFILHYQDGQLHAQEYNGTKRETKTDN